MIMKDKFVILNKNVSCECSLNVVEKLIMCTCNLSLYQLEVPSVLLVSTFN